MNIAESSSIFADFRGQRYMFDEAIFHATGLHKFPGRVDRFEGEYHIHMKTLVKPERALTLVIPMLFANAVITPNPYFSACSAVINPSVSRPTLSSLIPFGSDVLQYQGPDIRNRTQASPTNASCTNLTYDHQFLLVLTPVYITPSDLARIYQEGSLNRGQTVTDRPAAGVQPTQTSIDRKQIMKHIVLAKPGIIDPNPRPSATVPKCEKVNDPVEFTPDESESNSVDIIPFIEGITFAIGILIGCFTIDFISGFFWSWLFKGDAVKAWIPMKAVIIVGMCITGMFYYKSFLNYWQIS